MYANTQPSGGVLLVGIEKDGSISGCMGLSTSQLNDIELMGERHCHDARFDLKRVAVKNASGKDDFIIALRVYYRSDKLVENVRGEAFVRQGDEKHRLTEAEKREVRIGKGEIDYEREPVALKWPDDFDTALINEFVREYIEKRTLSGSHSREDVLCLNHLGEMRSGTFQPNLACALLFANDPRAVIPGARIRFLRFEGTQEGTGEKFACGPSDHNQGFLHSHQKRPFGSLGLLGGTRKLNGRSSSDGVEESSRQAGCGLRVTFARRWPL
jgi:ATP-dependent DNA helicase RecG